jgi:prepilin-type N-terminal cleavage/methylation domain-containing protein
MKSVHRVLQRLAQDESGFTLPELLVTIVISSLIVGALVSAFIVSAEATTASKKRLDESHDAQQVSAYFVADAANASYFSPTAVPTPAMASCADFGAGNVAIFEWTEGTTRKDAIYGTDGTPAQLFRRYCENGVKQSDVSLVKNIGSTAPVITCQPSAPCSAKSDLLELTVQERSTYAYTLRADPRTTAWGPTGPMGGIAIYIGGLMTTGGSKTTIQADQGVITVGGTATCNGDSDGNAVMAPDGFYGASGGSCNESPGTPPPDPLVSVPAPSKPATSTTAPTKNNGYVPPSSTACGSSKPTYQPGTYPEDWALENGCLASGTYFFKTGAALDNVSSAPGGVHIYIESGDSKLSNVTLSPLTAGDQALITIFAGRSNTGTIRTNDNVTVNGVIYAPVGELLVQSSSGSLRAGAINAAKLSFGGNSDGVILLGI